MECVRAFLICIYNSKVLLYEKEIQLLNATLKLSEKMPITINTNQSVKGPVHPKQKYISLLLPVVLFMEI